MKRRIYKIIVVIPAVLVILLLVSSGLIVDWLRWIQGVYTVFPHEQSSSHFVKP